MRDNQQVGSVAGAVRVRYRVASGSCLDCAGDVDGMLRRLDGVTEVQVLTTAGVVVVGHDGSVPAEKIQRAAARAGVGLEPATDRPTPAAASERVWWRQRSMLALAAAALLLAAGLVAEKLVQAEAAALGLYWATLVVGGIYPVIGAVRVLRSGRLTIGTLLVVGAAGAVALGVVEEAAMLVVVFSLGEVLEEYASSVSSPLCMVRQAFSLP
jgi:cation transport ATPase